MELLNCILAAVLVASALASDPDEILLNNGFETSSDWDCQSAITCTLTSNAYKGSGAWEVTGRTKEWHGPYQYVTVTPGRQYVASVYVKLLNELPGVPEQPIKMLAKLEYLDGTIVRQTVELYDTAKVSDGWIHLNGDFTVDNKPLLQASVSVSKPDPGVDFAVDQASLKEVNKTALFEKADQTIDQIRKNDIYVTVNTDASINRNDVEIQLLQTKKSFPFGVAVNPPEYNDDVANGLYRAFIHDHFNWAVTENRLKWAQMEKTPGDIDYQTPLDTINGLRSHGLKVRGHNLLWSVPDKIQDWVKNLTGQALRDTVENHINETMNVTRGLLEHWDVNNENLHGTWYQDTLNDPDYDLEIFEMVRRADPNPKLFLNDFHVVNAPWYTAKYRLQGLRFVNAGVGLYGMGAQCHFFEEEEPNIALIQQRLDSLADAGVPLWATEMDVAAADENTRADYYEKALKSLYGHPAVEGILMWGFWDQRHWRGEAAALAKGDNMTLTAAGVRVLDLLENQWMTDETNPAPSVGQQLVVRGFHGDYEARVIYQGSELTSLRTTFELGKSDYSLTINVPAQ